MPNSDGLQLRSDGLQLNVMLSQMLISMGCLQCCLLCVKGRVQVLN